jgi:hypothetical protein
VSSVVDQKIEGKEGDTWKLINTLTVALDAAVFLKNMNPYIMWDR